MKAVEEGGDYTIVQEARRAVSAIGTETSVSHTTFPEAYVDKVGDVVYYDCPGFADSRQATPHVEIANAVFLKNVADHAKKLKVLVAVNHFSVRRSADRSDFLDTLTLMKDLFNVTAFRGGIGLVVTKVEHKASDQEVIGYIAAFLKGVKRNLHITSSQEDLQQRKLLLEEFLRKNESGAYNRISIFRRPTSTGPLNTNEPIQMNKMAIQSMVDSLVSIGHDVDDVGYVLSTRARLLTKDVHVQLSKQTVGQIQHWAESLERTMQEMLDPDSKAKKSWSARQLEHRFALSQLPAMEELVSLQRITNYMIKFESSIDKEAVDVVANNARAMAFLQKVDPSIGNSSWTEAHQVLQKTSGSINRSLQKYFGETLDRLTNWLKIEYPQSFPTATLSSTELLTRFVEQHQSCIAEHQRERMKRWQLNESIDRSEAMEDTKSVLSCFEAVTATKNLEEVVWLKEKILLMSNSSGEVYDLLNTRMWQPMEVFFGRFLQIINRFSVKFDNKKQELVVHGDILSINKVVNSHEVATYRGKMKKLSIVARHTIFIDTQVNGTDLNKGESLDLIIISPIWWASVGHRIHLDGKLGAARNSETTRPFGAHGRPGVDGGNAGNFFGLGLDFRGTNLSVSARGGDGGPGEAGVGGEPGKQGETVENPSCSYSYVSSSYNTTILGVKYGYKCRNRSQNLARNFCKPDDILTVNGGPGSPGGDGGHGGEGGRGGQGGWAYVLKRNTNSNLEEEPNFQRQCRGLSVVIDASFNPGAKGPNGKGGIGGQGGMEGFKTEFELKKAMGGNRRKKRFLPIFAMLPALGLAAGAAAAAADQNNVNDAFVREMMQEMEDERAKSQAYIEKVQAEMMEAKAKAEKAAEQARADAQKAKAEAQANMKKVQAEMNLAKAKAEKAAEQARADAEKAKATAEKAAVQARADAQKAKAEAKIAAEKAIKEAEEERRRLVTCYLKPFGVKIQPNVSAPSGRNGKAGFIAHKPLPTAALHPRMKPNVDFNCTNLQSDLLQLLADPGLVAFVMLGNLQTATLDASETKGADLEMRPLRQRP